MIQETQVPNLAVMSSGPKPMNPTELFESQLLIDFIEPALEEFDHVIFDSGPIMVVAEAQAMAPRVDGVISVVRAKTNNRGLLQRMRDELRRTRPSIWAWCSMPSERRAAVTSPEHPDLLWL